MTIPTNNYMHSINRDADYTTLFSIDSKNRGAVHDKVQQETIALEKRAYKTRQRRKLKRMSKNCIEMKPRSLRNYRMKLPHGSLECIASALEENPRKNEVSNENADERDDDGGRGGLANSLAPPRVVTPHVQLTMEMMPPNTMDLIVVLIRSHGCNALAADSRMMLALTLYTESARSTLAPMATAKHMVVRIGNAKQHAITRGVTK